MAPLSGTDPRHLGGFRVLTLLAVGGMGRVYLALGPDRRAVALKVARPEIAADARFRTRFRREVATAREVGSGSGGASLIAPVVAADPDAELPWLASEYVPGPSVTDAAMEFGPLGEPGLRTLTHGLALALTEVHATGVVHRDVKPSNVLLARDGPRLIDFGVARAIDDVSLTRVGALIGSPGFLSPEQAVGDPATFGSDIFAMASVVAYAARGQSPFGAGDGPALLYRVVHEPPKLEGLPADLTEVLASCLAKNPAERPTAPEIAARIPPADDWLPKAVLDDIARREAELNAWLEVTAADPPTAHPAEEPERSTAGFDTVADSALHIANARIPEPRPTGGTRRRAGEQPAGTAGQAQKPAKRPRPGASGERGAAAEGPRQPRPPRIAAAGSSLAPMVGSQSGPEAADGPAPPPRTSHTDLGSPSNPTPPVSTEHAPDLPRRADREPRAVPWTSSRPEPDARPEGIRPPGLPRSAAPPNADAPGLSSYVEPDSPSRSSRAELDSPAGNHLRHPAPPPTAATAAPDLSSRAEPDSPVGNTHQPAAPDLGAATPPGAAYTAFLLDPKAAETVEPAPKAEPAHRAPHRRRFPIYAAAGALVGAAVAAAILLLSPTRQSSPPAPSPEISAAPTKAKAAPPTLSSGRSGLEQRPGTTSASGSRR